MVDNIGFWEIKRRRKAPKSTKGKWAGLVDIEGISIDTDSSHGHFCKSPSFISQTAELCLEGNG